MDQRHLARRLGAVAATLLLTASRAVAPPPLPPRTMPGKTIGEVDAEWIAPHVLHIREGVAGRWTHRVRWFTPDGKVRRELVGNLDVSARRGFISEHTRLPGKNAWRSTIHAANDDWKLVLPRKPGPSGYITCTPDSRTFIHQHHPQEGQIAVDVYVHGKLVSTLGPFEQYLGRGVRLGGDGSLAFLAWKDKAKKIAQIVAADRDGKLSFRAECPFQVGSPVVAPNGMGVLVQPNFGEDARTTFTFHKKTGEVHTRKFWPNPHVAAWIPGTCKALLQTSFGHEKRFVLVDWATGETLWGIDDPVSGRVAHGTAFLTATKNYVILGGIEPGPRRADQRVVRSLCAIDAATGEIVGHWLSDSLWGGVTSQGRFLRLGGSLYLIFRTEFCGLSLDDIRAKRNGWK